MSDRSERIVLALDAIAETGPAIDLAVRLAACAKLRLRAVFIEDADLLDLAGSSVAREVVAGGPGGPLRAEQVELFLRSAADRAQQEVRAAARDHALEYSFEVVRGAVDTALLVVGKGDLVVAGGLARPIAGHFRVESRWSPFVTTATGLFLLIKEGRKNSRRVAALLSGRGAAAARLLQTAAQLAELEGGALTVICPPALAETGDFVDWVEAQVAAAGLRLQIEAAPEDLTAVETRIAQLNCGLLGLEAAAVVREQLAVLTKRFAGDVLVVN